MPRFPSRLSKLIIQQNDDTIKENITQMIIAMKKSGYFAEAISDKSIVAELLAKYKFVDNKISEEAIKQKVNSICRKGCNDCCYEYFYFSMGEYFALRYELVQQGMLEQAIDIAKKQFANMQRQQPYEYAKLNDKSIGKSTVRSFSDNEYISRYELCPCNINGECVVYKARPFVCRIFGATNQYATCPTIHKKINQGKARKHVVMLRFDLEALKEGLDKIIFKNKPFAARPFPLMYWLSHDEKYLQIYHIAIGGTKQAYFKAVYDI